MPYAHSETLGLHALFRTCSHLLTLMSFNLGPLQKKT